jgi:hypothetical protein
VIEKGESMKRMTERIYRHFFLPDDGMEMVQVAILVAIAIILGLIFKTEITSFINKTFQSLNADF